MITNSNEESLEFYKNLSIHPVGTPKDKILSNADINMTDADLVAFYSERYANVDVADFLLKDRKERLFGLCNMVREGEFYLDVGCANGGHMEVLHKRGIEGIGLDLSVPNILRGRIKYPYLKFIHGFAEEIPFKESFFDIVLLGDAIEHFRDPKTTLAECLRVTKKGLVICIPIKEEFTEEHINPFSAQKILDLLEFYKLRIQFFNHEGVELNKNEALQGLQSFMWLFVRVEKTSVTNNVVKEILNSAGKEIENRAKKEILDKDQWNKDFERVREETEIARFNLISNLIEGNRVLEIGCGNGDASIEMATKGIEVIGIDISESGIKQANDTAVRKNVQEKIKFFTMDATNLLFPENSFDSIVIPEVLEHIRSPRKILEEAIRVVRNGGRIIISVPDGLLIPWEGHIRVFFKDTLKTEINQYAEVIEWHELPFKKWLICSFFVRKKSLDIIEGHSVDILMPTFNGRKTLGKAIKSVIDQTYQNWNLIIVNDGGENIIDIINGFHDERIKYISSEHNGKSHALNLAIKNSNGEYISYLDDDDIVYPIHLEDLIKTAHEKKKDFIYSDWYEVSVDENDKELKREVEFRVDVTPAMLIFKNYINHKCILHKRSLLERTGLYDETLDILIDWDMTRRLAFECKPYHLYSFTSERFQYFNSGVLQNRITGLWNRNPDIVFKSLDKIVEKTNNLRAGSDDLVQAFKYSMFSMSYFNSFECNKSLQIKNREISVLENRLLETNNKVEYLKTKSDELDFTIKNIRQSIVWKSLMKYQRIVDKTFPSGTRRRKFYDKIFLGLRQLAN